MGNISSYPAPCSKSWLDLLQFNQFSSNVTELTKSVKEALSIHKSNARTTPDTPRSRLIVTILKIGSDIEL